MNLLHFLGLVNLKYLFAHQSSEVCLSLLVFYIEDVGEGFKLLEVAIHARGADGGSRLFSVPLLMLLRNGVQQPDAIEIAVVNLSLTSFGDDGFVEGV